MGWSKRLTGDEGKTADGVPPPQPQGQLVPSVLPPSSNHELPPKDERPYAKTVCPSCGVEPAKLPKADDGRRYLLRESDLEGFAQAGERVRDKREQQDHDALVWAGFLIGDNYVEVVGESHYKTAIRRLRKRGDRMFVARLVRESDNNYEENAIRVEIEGEQVGHINRDDAEEMREFMISLERQGRPAWVQAELNGGSDGRYIGVELYGLPDYL